MKAFVAISIIFAAMIGCIVFNYLYINRVSVGLSVSFVELNRVSDAITSMKSYAASGEDADFECTRELLLNAIREMRRLEAFTIGNIF